MLDVQRKTKDYEKAIREAKDDNAHEKNKKVTLDRKNPNDDDDTPVEDKMMNVDRNDKKVESVGDEEMNLNQKKDSMMGAPVKTLEKGKNGETEEKDKKKCVIL